MVKTVHIGDARQFLKKNGKCDGNSVEYITQSIYDIYNKQKNSVTGKVCTLCVSPEHGSRDVCKTIYLKQSVLNDCQSKTGIQHIDDPHLQIKNNNEILLEDDVFIESLLCGVSVNDYNFVKKIVHGLKKPRLNEVCVTGDNIYIKNIDMSWSSHRRFFPRT